MATVLGVIPARFHDARFPGKVLAQIGGRSVLEWTYRAVSQVQGIGRIVIGTDDERVRDTAAGFGAEILMTSEEHRTGTDRLAEVVAFCGEGFDTVLNVHGNLPGLDPAIVSRVLELKAANPGWEVTTAARPFLPNEDPLSPNAVKVVVTKRNRALYFSRSLIPFPRTKTGGTIYRHVGIYAYERAALLRFQTLPQSNLEESEALEQLRVLENDGTVGVCIVEGALPSVSAPEDVSSVARLMQDRGLFQPL